MRTWQYGLLPKYPRLSKFDSEIWEQFIKTHPNHYYKVAYDVLVGNGAILQVGDLDPYQKDFNLLTRKRIDVVGFKNNQIDIIEVKPRASSTALGQSLNYTRLFKDEYKQNIKVEPVIITNRSCSDDMKLFDMYSIELFIV